MNAMLAKLHAPAVAVRQLARIGLHEAAACLLGKRAKIITALLVFGGLAPNVLLMWFGPGRSGSGGSQMAESQARLMLRLYDSDVARSLDGCPPEVISFGIFALLFTPLCVLLLGFDVVSRDRERGTDRYLCQRVGRSILVLGKVLGLWLAVAAVLATLHVLLWLCVLVARPEAWTSLWPWMPRLWLAGAVFVLPYAGLATLVSALVGTSTLAPVAGLAVLSGLWMAKLIAHIWPAAAWIEPLLPGTNDAGLLMADNGARLGIAAAVLFGWTALSTAMSMGRYRLQDLQ